MSISTTSWPASLHSAAVSASASIGRNRILWALGLALAASALVVRQKARQAERDNPPLGKFIDIDDVTLHYVERGQGQPLVLLHGNGSMVEDFEISGLLDMAASRYRVIAFDRPGHGHSTRGSSSSPKAQAAVLHKALQRMGVTQPIVVGHSWGTLVALTLALDYPADVRSLVLLSGYYFPTMRLDVLLASPPALPILGTLMRHTVSPLMGRLIWPIVKKKLFGPALVPSKFAEFPVWMTLRPSQMRASALESAMMIPTAMSLRRRYPELTMPVVIMAGSGDLIANAQSQSGRLHDVLPGSDLRLVEGAGHMVHQLHPLQVMGAIDAANSATQESALLGSRDRAEAADSGPAWTPEALAQEPLVDSRPV